MTIQEMVDKAIEDKRKLRMQNTSQLTLGELIRAIEEAGTKDDKGEDKDIRYDFGYMRPTHLDSWRGSYAELALGYKEEWNDRNNPTAEDILQDCKNAIGKTFEGYKGGEFIMDKNTPIWVDNYGCASDTAVIGILDKGYRLIILTEYNEY